MDSMKERPILFSGPMVKAILDGRKTQTRRVVKIKLPLSSDPYYATGRVLTDLPGQPGAFMEFRYRSQDEPGFTGSTASFLIPCPYGQPDGDKLWVRETWRRDDFAPGEFLYRADMPTEALEGGKGIVAWKPSIHMPRLASRLTLEITEVRVERLQDVSEADAQAEGCETAEEMLPSLAAPYYGGQKYVAMKTYRAGYKALWDSINGKTYPWDSNPFVWAITFTPGAGRR